MKQKIIKYLENKADLYEMIEISNWCKQSPINKEEFKLFKSEWINNNIDSTAKEYQYEWDSLLTAIYDKEKISIKNRKIEWIKYAAIIVFTVGAAMIGSYIILNSSKTTTNQTLAWDNGNISKITLPDGSLVIMNSGSSINYNNNFGISNRIITLSGEAFFKVKKHEKTPFYVVTEQIKIEVLGTEFSVSNYQEIDDIEIILKEGSISITETEGKRKYLINPGELFAFNKTDLTAHIKKVNPKHYMSWVDGYQYFYNEPLDNICKKLEKRFDCKIITDKLSSQLHCTFAIHNENLNQTLHLIKSITNVTIIQENDIFYIKQPS